MPGALGGREGTLPYIAQILPSQGEVLGAGLPIGGSGFGELGAQERGQELAQRTVVGAGHSPLPATACPAAASSPMIALRGEDIYLQQTPATRTCRRRPA